MTTAELSALPPVGAMLRDWRRRRRLSQLDLALEAGVSARHLSFVETGRSKPSPDMLLHLAEQLDVPLRDRNGMLLAAGYAPQYAEHDLDDPAMSPIRDAIDRVLKGHEPYPAVVVDRAWEMVAANAAIGFMLEGVSPELLQPPVNVLRIALHPEGMAPSIINHGEWRAHLLDRLQRQIALTGDPALRTLHDELAGYPAPPYEHSISPGAEIAVPLRVRTKDGAELAFISTIATFGTAIEVTLAELAIESFFPADETTATAIRDLAASARAGAGAGAAGHR